MLFLIIIKFSPYYLCRKYLEKFAALALVRKKDFDVIEF
jgi:hypothetical protein